MRWIMLDAALPQKQEFPSGEYEPDINRKRQCVGRGRRLDRFARHEECIERSDVVVGNQREMIVRKCRIKVSSVAIDAFAHRPCKRSLGPLSDAGLWIW